MIKKRWYDKHLSVANRLLLLAIVLLNGYVIITPFLPQVTHTIGGVFVKPADVSTSEARAVIDKSYDHVVIPGIRLDENIWFGASSKLLNKGVWHIPYSSKPDKGSNTVLVGHRFSYKDPAVFYHLDKVNVGDPIVVAYGGKLYTYTVNETKIVQPTDVYVEAATEEDMLTIYTCHPLWSIKERLVVTAVLETIE